jgi:uncharacterized membrane protein YphA (DoxX/SURF4 family)/thiol-disulfide isomerase/thioredoxin
VSETGLEAFVLLALRVALALVFVVAGFAKLRDPEGTAGMLAGFGVPARLTALSARLLPLSELVVAALLGLNMTVGVGAATSTVLLSLFTAAMVANLVMGRKVSCRCFGQAAPADVGPVTLVRNGVLIALSLCVLIATRPWTQDDALAWIASNGLALGLGVLVLAAYGGLAFALYEIIAQQGRILLRLETIEAALGVAANAPHAEAQPAGLPVGAKAPELLLTSLDGGVHALVDFARERPHLLFFMNPSCGPCHALMPDVLTWNKLLGGAVSVQIVSEGTAAENQEAFASGADLVVVQEERNASEAYQVYGTPGALLVDAQGTIASHAAMGADAIRALLTAVLAKYAPPGIDRGSERAVPAAGAEMH